MCLFYLSLQGRFQFYIVVYDFYLPMPNDPLKGRYAVDRFAINVDLSAVPDYRCRQKYYGIYNISQFDLSFEIGCSENFLGLGCNISSPDCNTSFTTVPVPLCNEPGSEIPVTTSAPSLPTGSTSGTSPTVLVAPGTSGGPPAGSTSVTTFGTSPTVVVAPVTSGGPSADNTSVTTFGYNSKDVWFLKYHKVSEERLTLNEV